MDSASSNWTDASAKESVRRASMSSGDRHTRPRRRSYRYQVAQELERKSAFGGGSIGFGTHLSCFVRSDAFDYSMGAALLANAALMGIEADYFAQAKSFTPIPVGDPESPTTFRILDLGFCMVFLIELLLRMSVYRSAFFRGEGVKWNVFDLLVVLLQVLDEFVKIMFVGTVVQEHFKNIGILRMLRLARLLRLVRMVRLIPELKSMVYLIYASIGSFFWSLVLILIMIYCYAIYYTEIVTDMVNDSLVPEVDFEDLQTRWGSVGVSVLTLWMAITGGDDWRNFTDVLRYEKLYALHLILFVVYIAFGTLVMLNLVTGVFVESAQRIMKEDKDAELTNLAWKIFKATDVDESQEISIEEFQEQLGSGLMQDYLKAIGIQSEELEHLYHLLDTDNNGSVNASEFIKGCLRLRGPARALDMAEMEYRVQSSLQQLFDAFSRMVSQGCEKTNLLQPRVEQATPTTLPVVGAWGCVNADCAEEGFGMRQSQEQQRFEEVLV